MRVPFIHLIKVSIFYIGKAAHQFKANKLRSNEIECISRVGESNDIEEGVSRKVLDKVSHASSISIAFLLCFQRGAVLKSQKHFANLIIIGILNQHDVERIGIESNA